jgi:hypothetical protein
MKSKVRLTVHLLNGDYYAMISAAGSKKPDPDREVFFIERDIDSWEISDLQNEALLRAKGMGISQIVGINRT